MHGHRMGWRKPQHPQLPQAAPKGVPALPAITPIPTLPVPQAPILEHKPMNEAKQFDASPLWSRLFIDPPVGGTTFSANSAVRVFDKDQNTNPDLTNLELAGAMPATSKFTIVAIEIRPRPTCSAAALAKFLGHTKLKLNVGAKQFEVVNQPSTMFPSVITLGVAGLEFTARNESGLYKLGESNQIKLEQSQPFNCRFEVDTQGFQLADAEVLDLDVIFKGVKEATLTFG